MWVRRSAESPKNGEKKWRGNETLWRSERGHEPGDSKDGQNASLRKEKKHWRDFTRHLGKVGNVLEQSEWCRQKKTGRGRKGG